MAYDRNNVFARIRAAKSLARRFMRTNTSSHSTISALKARRMFW